MHTGEIQRFRAVGLLEQRCWVRWSFGVPGEDPRTPGPRLRLITAGPVLVPAAEDCLWSTNSYAYRYLIVAAEYSFYHCLLWCNGCVVK